MSIIGPRPILDWEFEENNNKPEYIRRFDVRPGLQYPHNGILKYICLRRQSLPVP